MAIGRTFASRAARRSAAPTAKRARPPPALGAELGHLIEPYNDKGEMGIFGHWKAWGGSTLAVGQLRRATDFTVPLFRAEAQDLYQKLGKALASADADELRKLATPTQYSQLIQSLESRSASEVHTYEATDVVAHIRQVRLGHAASAPELKFAQVTAAISARVVWRVCDAAGEIVGGLGADDPPYDIKQDLWVFESCTTETPALGWRLKARLGLEADPEKKS